MFMPPGVPRDMTTFPFDAIDEHWRGFAVESLCKPIQCKLLTVHTGPIVLQVEDHLIHRNVSLEEPPARIKQNKTGQQTQDQMAIRGVFIVDLAGIQEPTSA
jgi:hypothetical protein